MKQMGAGAFKARCLSMIRDIQKTGEPVLVTKNGKPLVKVIGAGSEKDDGFMAGKFKIIGDIESPVWPLKRRDLFPRQSSTTKPRAKSRASR